MHSLLVSGAKSIYTEDLS